MSDQKSLMNGRSSQSADCLRRSISLYFFVSCLYCIQLRSGRYEKNVIFSISSFLLNWLKHHLQIYFYVRRSRSDVKINVFN